MTNDEIITTIENLCQCRFDRIKDKLQEIIDKRKDEPIDTGCIE